MKFTLTYQEDRWNGEIHQCQGWILRYNGPGIGGARWFRTLREALAYKAKLLIG